MSWRLAESLAQLRVEINQAHPGRSRASDGTVGDPAHASRRSDHNPDGDGVVKAFDLTHDPANGVDCGVIAEKVKDDERVAFLIWRRRIWNRAVSPEWRPYNGSNPHDKHLHISVLKAHCDDDSPWFKEDDMPLNDADKAWIKKLVQETVNGGFEARDQLWRETAANARADATADPHAVAASAADIADELAARLAQ